MSCLWFWDCIYDFDKSVRIVRLETEPMHDMKWSWSTCAHYEEPPLP